MFIKNGCILQYSNAFSHGTRIPREHAAGIADPYNIYAFLSCSNEENSWKNDFISFFRCYQNFLKALMFLINNYISYSSSLCSTLNTIPFQNKTSSFKAWALNVSNNTMTISATGKSNYYFFYHLKEHLFIITLILSFKKNDKNKPFAQWSMIIWLPY